jgi:plasmid maintenance system antidote protein VapI
MAHDLLAPVHPGEILREEFLSPLGMTPYARSSILAPGVPVNLPIPSVAN